jgi:hypothetical protein
MARRTTKEADADLYERDYLAWVERQVMLLRAGRLQDLDLANLIEEVEDLGRSERNTVESHTRQVILHLLKLRHSPAPLPRAGWLETVAVQRGEIDSRLTSSLRTHLAASLERVYRQARRAVLPQLARDGVRPQDLPDTCPFTLAQILDEAWLPENLHGQRDAEQV